MADNSASAPNEGKPIAVDLDGTLIKSDTLAELWVRLVRRDVGAIVRSLWWLRKGRANLKSELAGHTAIDVTTLPYNIRVIDWLRRKKEGGADIWLVTACDQRVAERIAAHLQLFTGVMGTANGINLTGRIKAAALENKFGLKGFDYIGNSRKDLPVWEKAQTAYAVTGSNSLQRRIARVANLEKVWGADKNWLSAWWQALRPHHWVKNLLLLIPMLADHQLSLAVGIRVAGAVAVFSLLASAVYLINDLVDLEADRRHETKKMRPLAAGNVAIWQAGVAAVILLGAGIWLAAQYDALFVQLVVSYLVLNLFYSLGAKQIVLLDVIILAVLYGIRVLAGGAAANITVSDWLMALILFLALSGALMKRYIELNRMRGLNNGNLSGRGYVTGDMGAVGQMGIACGYLGVLVMALYINSTQVNRLYKHPEYWWLVALLMLYGVSRGWLNAYRGRIDDDPIMYIVKDPIYYWIIGMTIILAILAI